MQYSAQVAFTAGVESIRVLWACGAGVGCEEEEEGKFSRVHRSVSLFFGWMVPHPSMSNSTVSTSMVSVGILTRASSSVSATSIVMF